MRISDWSSDVCSSDLRRILERGVDALRQGEAEARDHALHALRRIVQAVVARARKADDDAVAGALVRTDALACAEILDPPGVGRGAKPNWEPDGHPGEPEAAQAGTGRAAGRGRGGA